MAGEEVRLVLERAVTRFICRSQERVGVLLFRFGLRFFFAFFHFGGSLRIFGVVTCNEFRHIFSVVCKGVNRGDTFAGFLSQSAETDA